MESDPRTEKLIKEFGGRLNKEQEDLIRKYGFIASEDLTEAEKRTCQ